MLALRNPEGEESGVGAGPGRVLTVEGSRPAASRRLIDHDEATAIGIDGEPDPARPSFEVRDSAGARCMAVLGGSVRGDDGLQQELEGEPSGAALLAGEGGPAGAELGRGPGGDVSSGRSSCWSPGWPSWSMILFREGRSFTQIAIWA